MIIPGIPRNEYFPLWSSHTSTSSPTVEQLARSICPTFADSIRCSHNYSRISFSFLWNPDLPQRRGAEVDLSRRLRATRSAYILTSVSPSSLLIDIKCIPISRANDVISFRKGIETKWSGRAPMSRRYPPSSRRGRAGVVRYR